ncbi:MAG: hypothetical protein DLD55_03820 [candidate division SR1 bacterium]|nr:MAG: hypothetical protein DLD55_03820 [candidate division SR1 bacterium]
MVRNDNNIFTIKGQNPIIDKNKKETIILDNDFYALFPKKIEGLYLLTKKENIIPLLPTSLIERFNHFLAGESEIKDNLYHGDCMDLPLTPGEWVERDKNGELGTPNKEYFTLYQNQNTAYKPVIYYHKGERKHAALSLGKGFCLLRMGKGGDLVTTTISNLKEVYGYEIWIKN